MTPADVILAAVVLLLLAAVSAGMSHIVSKYTDIGFLEPFMVTLVAAVVFIVANYKDSAAKFTEQLTEDRDVLSTVFSLTALFTVLTAGQCVLVLIGFFTVYGVMAMFAKRCTGTLTRVEMPEGKKIRFAYYTIGGQEYQCAIGGVSKKLKLENEYKVRLSRLQNKVYDRSAVMSCFVGAGIIWIAAALFVIPLIFMEYLP
ncbi:MAG: hypothetical protein IJ779_05445 [Ruminococcus sp.]|nr:hypothetical protein [Ruminococcus sp.]